MQSTNYPILCAARATRRITVVLTLVTWEKERKEKRRDELTQAQGLIQKQEGKKKKKRKKKTPSPSRSRPANQHADELGFFWRPKNLCVVIWHHQLPIKGEVTFFLFSPPSSSTFEDAWGNVMQLSKRNKDPFKHFLFSPHIRSLTWKKRVV